MATILETRDVSRVFDALVAVDGVSMKVEEGTFHSLIGPNGAGKTTLFNVISGTLPASGGFVFFKGEDVTNLPVYRTAHIGMGRSFQITNLFSHLPVIENIRLSAQALGHDSFKLFSSFRDFPDYLEKAAAAMELVGLTDRALDPVQDLSHGDQRKLELAMILASDPEVLLLDEPTAGMGAEDVPGFIELIQSVQEAGDKTVLLVEHNMNVVMRASDAITVMHQGQVLAEGTPTEISDNEQVQEAYLGHGSFGGAG